MKPVRYEPRTLSGPCGGCRGRRRSTSATKVAAYAADPASQAANVQALKGEAGVLRLRVGDWRVIFEDGAVIAVIRIGPRGGVHD